MVRGQGYMDRHCYTDTGFPGGIHVPQSIEVHQEERAVQTATFRMGHEEWGFPGSSAGKESACNAGDPQFDSWVRRNPWRRGSLPTPVFLGSPDGSDSKVSTCNAGDLGSIPGSGKSPEGGHGNPLQYSCWEKPHGQRSLASCSPWGHKELDTIELLSTHTSMKSEKLARERKQKRNVLQAKDTAWQGCGGIRLSRKRCWHIMDTFKHQWASHMALVV